LENSTSSIAGNAVERSWTATTPFAGAGEHALDEPGLELKIHVERVGVNVDRLGDLPDEPAVPAIELAGAGETQQDLERLRARDAREPVVIEICCRHERAVPLVPDHAQVHHAG
jgi:hypothetical protein